MPARTKTRLVFEPEYAPDPARQRRAVSLLLSLPPSDPPPAAPAARATLDGAADPPRQWGPPGPPSNCSPEKRPPRGSLPAPGPV